jgi:hypothetical protein
MATISPSVAVTPFIFQFPTINDPLAMALFLFLQRRFHRWRALWQVACGKPQPPLQPRAFQRHHLCRTLFDDRTKTP